ncbi:TolC family protein [Sulfurimonas sp. HSL-1656]|uniref:TolC family protein n=1 Tax=Thiomicrolovo subterrani TaxID=3131934 RepID=UPI0031F93E83
MFRPLLALLFAAAALRAEGIDTLIDRSLEQHHSLKMIEQRLGAYDALEDKSSLFANPELLVGINDIQFDDPMDRTLEPMQFTSVSIRQKFPWFGKRGAAGEKVRAQKAVLFASLEAAQAELAKRIRLRAYTVAELNARLGVLQNYLELTEQNIALNTAYASTQRDRHMGIMSAELLRSDIAVRREKLTAMLTAQKARLAYLVQAPFDTVEADEAVAPPPPLENYLQRLENNRIYRVKAADQKAAAAETKVKALSANADPFVMVGYYYREAHPDYLSLTVGAALPLYGAERDDTEAARKAELASAEAAADYRLQLRSEIEAAYAALTEAYRTYRIITEESLPQVEHMVDLSDAKLRSGSDLFNYFDLLERKLRFDEQRIAAKADYLRAGARLKALTGEIK